MAFCFELVTADNEPYDAPCVHPPSPGEAHSAVMTNCPTHVMTWDIP
jgi:hypothetical protein